MNQLRILIGVDFSPASADAARWTAHHFGNGAELILAHAITLPKPPIMSSRHGKHELVLETLVEGARKRLQDLRDLMQAQNVSLEVREGEPAATLAEIATESKADLLIVGVRGERTGKGQSGGTTAERAVRELSIPVLVVARPSERPVSLILVAVEEETTARESLRWAGMLSNRFNARVTSLYVGGDAISPAARADSSQRSPGADDKETRTDSSSDPWTELARSSGILPERVTSEKVAGVPAVEIASASERHDADILVMGRRSARSLRRAVLGSVTATVLRNPPCNVLVVSTT